MLAELVAITAPVFLSVAIGFLWARGSWPFDNALVARLVMYVGTPALLVSTFNRSRPTAEAFAEMAAASVLGYAVMAVLAILLLHALRLGLRDFLPALLFPNSGNMGLPLVLFAFGDKGLALGIVVFAFAALGHFTVGISLARGSASLSDLLRTPLVYALAAGIFLVVTGLGLPRWLANAAELLAGLTIPLMLIALGVSLSRLRVGALGRATLLAGVRLGGGFLVALAVCRLVGLEGVARGVLLLQFSMPVAVYSYLFAERYGRAASDVAGMVMLSTLLSFATLPLLLWFAL